VIHEGEISAAPADRPLRVTRARESSPPPVSSRWKPFPASAALGWLFYLVLPMPRKKVIPVVAEPTETCKSCKCGWFVEMEDSAVWFCRLNPPTVTYDMEDRMQVSTFPVVAADQWCSHFAPLLNS
jgi:hypothetical protein